MERILVTGAGGIGGVNFVRALRASKEEFFIAGTQTLTSIICNFQHSMLG